MPPEWLPSVAEARLVPARVRWPRQRARWASTFAGAVGQALHFLDLLERWNAVYNLTAIRDPEPHVYSTTF